MLWRPAEMTKKDLECYINFIKLVDQVVAGFERTNSSFERSSPVGKMLSNREIVHKRRVNQYGKLHCCLILRNCHSHPQPSANTTLIGQHPLTMRYWPKKKKKKCSDWELWVKFHVGLQWDSSEELLHSRGSQHIYMTLGKGDTCS